MHVDKGMGHAHTCVREMFAGPYWQSSIIIRTCACAKVCTDMCTDMRMDMCTDMRMDMGMCMCVH